MTKLDKSKFSPLFGTWWSKIEPFFDSGGFDTIYDKLKADSARGVKIAPISSLVYRCFQETAFNNCKVVICGFCPYHSFTKDGIAIADGLCMSCETTGKLQPSLRTFYQGLEEELYEGLNLSYNPNPSLQYLAKQGVLLFNSSLTVAQGKPGSHGDLWQEFTKYFFENVIGYTGIPIIFLGAEAAKFNRWVTPFTHTFITKHPAYYARLEQPYDGEGAYKAVNQIIRQNNGKEFEIKWLEEYD